LDPLHGIGSEAGAGAVERAIESAPDNVTLNLTGLDVQFEGRPAIGTTFSEVGNLGGSETILLVEDELFVRNVTTEVLKSAGYGVLVAASAAQALLADRKHVKPVQLLLTDVVMPSMNGCELAVEFGRLHPGIKVLLMSGYAEQLSRCELFLSTYACLAKPFTACALLKKMRQVLDGIRS
jgi:CheY-like chemotaxis protein